MPPNAPDINMTTNLTLAAWWRAVGNEAALETIRASGLSRQFVTHVRDGHKPMSRVASIAFIDAVRRTTPGIEPNIESLLRGSPRQSFNSVNRHGQPDAQNHSLSADVKS